MHHATTSSVPRNAKTLRYLWSIIPLVKVQTLALPIATQKARERLLTAIDGNWSIDGGIRYTAKMVAYRDIHQYSGVVIGHTFNVVGPMGFGLMPMLIQGELQEHGQTSTLRLIVRTSLFTSLRKMGRTVVALLCLGGVGALVLWFGGVDEGQLSHLGLFALLAGGFYLAVTYLLLICVLHRQTNLLLTRFNVQLDISQSAPSITSKIA